MEHMVGALAGAAAGIEVADIALDEGEARPGLLAHGLAHHVEIFLIAGEEVVEPGDILAEAEQVEKCCLVVSVSELLWHGLF